MSELFDVAEMVRIAVEDERTGVALYTALGESSKGKDTKAIFQKLVGQERYHQMRFESILEQMGGLKPREGYDGEYVAYLRTLTSTRAFPDTQAAVEAARRCSSDAACLGLAGQYERETLAFLVEVAEMVGPKQQDVVMQIIREERQHVVVLAEAGRKLPA